MLKTTGCVWLYLQSLGISGFLSKGVWRDSDYVTTIVFQIWQLVPKYLRRKLSQQNPHFLESSRAPGSFLHVLGSHHSILLPVNRNMCLITKIPLDYKRVKDLICSHEQFM